MEGAAITRIPALRRVCSQLRTAVHVVFFEENTFYLVDILTNLNAVFQTTERKAGASAAKMTSVSIMHRLAMPDSEHLRSSVKLCRWKGLTQRACSSTMLNARLLTNLRSLGVTEGYCCCGLLQTGFYTPAQCQIPSGQVLGS